MRIVVIIPTYNEKENIGPMLYEMLNISRASKSDEYLTLVVDDRSPDGTGEVVKAFVKKHKNIVLLSGKKEGLGKAMIKAYKFALKLLRPDVIVTTEADFAYDPKYIPQTIKKIKEGYDVVVGSRHLGGGATEGWTIARKVNHWVANKFFATWIAGVDEIYDHNGAFRAIKVKGILERIKFDEIKVSGFGFFNYFLFKIFQLTNNIYELPIVYRFRVKGESKVSFNPKYLKTYIRDVFEYIKLSFKIRLDKMKMKLE